MKNKIILNKTFCLKNMLFAVSCLEYQQYCNNNELGNTFHGFTGLINKRSKNQPGRDVVNKYICTSLVYFGPDSTSAKFLLIKL